MAEVIQFPCPACGTTLKLPLALAAVQGPCPRCRQDIVAPDPAHDLPARMAALAASSPSEPPPPPLTEPKILSSSPLISEPDVPLALKPNFPLLPILLIAAASLVAGYFIGTASVRRTSSPAPVRLPALEAALPEPAVTAPPEPAASTAADARPAPVPEPALTPGPVKVSAAAEAALRAFLDAPDWATRAAHVLTPDTVRPAMEAYSHTVPDGPTAFESVSVQNSYTDRETGNTLFIFKVVTADHPTGIPVAVAETDSGWLIDWQAFIEFRDNLFEAFADGPVDATGRFHLLVSAPPPPRAANTENQHFSSFLVEPPFPDKQRIAYVRKNDGIHPVLARATTNGAVFTPVLEVAKRETPDGKSYLEITDIVAHDWLPEGR